MVRAGCVMEHNTGWISDEIDLEYRRGDAQGCLLESCRCTSVCNCGQMLLCSAVC